jgi:HNH endonuclease
MKTCNVRDCGSPITNKGARGLCPLHYQRALRGVPVEGRKCPTCGASIPTAMRQAGPKYCSDECKPRCAVEGCDSPRRKRMWCASHYGQWKRTGVDPVPFGYKWSERTACLVCGEPSAAQYRQFCSAACRLRRNHPTSKACIGCGVAIDLTARTKRGQRKKVCVKFCRRCKAEYNKYKLTAHQLAERDGTDCGICGQLVDMTLRKSESGMCASVDHILPRALGGTHDPENLQLAHLYCNQVKSDRVGIVAPEEVSVGG